MVTINKLPAVSQKLQLFEQLIAKLLVQKATHQMTHFRDGKVFKNLATDEIDDHRTQSDHKWTTKIQKERTLHLVMRLRGETEHDTNDNVTTKTQSTFHTARMNINT